MVHYFAYGSNMNMEDLNEWCRRKSYNRVEPISHGIAHLGGYKLAFNYLSTSRRSNALNIMISPDESVCGVLFELEKEDFEKISEKEQGLRKELAPYKKIPVTVEVEGEKIEALTFKVRKKYETDFREPISDYLKIVVEGARDFGLLEECINKIKRAAAGA